jgi:aminoglycoside phosphotransferase (APT) family kinase protein
MDETKPVPAEEALDTARLSAWLREHVGLAVGEIRLARFSGGHANLTYLLTAGGHDLVIRRPPLGPVAPGSHDMGREHRVLSALHQAFPLAPRSLAYCDDVSVIGAPFLVAERRHGMAITPDLPRVFHNRPDIAAGIGAMLVDTLADLHRVDAARLGLDALGRPEGFLARQLDGWRRRWYAALDRPYPEAEPLLARLAANLPASPAPALVHNDFKLDNILVDPADPRVPRAVLDWDMATRGDPLLDLGYLLTYWAEPSDPPEWIEAASMPTWREGFPSRAEVVARYAAATGTDGTAIAWYQAFATFKLAVIVQQIFIRFARGQTSDPRFRDFDRRVAALVAKAAAQVSRV